MLLHEVENLLRHVLSFILSNDNDMLGVCWVILHFWEGFNANMVLTVLHYDCLAEMEDRRCSQEFYSCLVAHLEVVICSSGNLH